MAWESQEAQAPDERPCTSGTWFWSSTVYSWGHYTVPWQIRFVCLSPQPTVQVLSCLLHTRLLSWKTSHTHVGTMYVWYTNAMRTASHLSASSWVLLAFVWVGLGILNSDWHETAKHHAFLWRSLGIKHFILQTKDCGCKTLWRMSISCRAEKYRKESHQEIDQRNAHCSVSRLGFMDWSEFQISWCLHACPTQYSSQRWHWCSVL